MKAKFEFNLPEENDDYNIYSNAKNYYLALWGLSQQIRQWYKYEEKDSINIEELTEKF